MRSLGCFFVIIGLFVGGGCDWLKNSGQGRTEATMGAAVSAQCSTDSATVCASTPPVLGGAAPVNDKTISGRCELVISGSSEVKPCTAILLRVRSRQGKMTEERAAVIDGFNFKFTDLTQTSYELVAASPEYEVSTDTKELKPGQTVKLRLGAKRKN